MAVQKSAVSLEDFERLIALPENLDRRFELINGEIIEKVPTQLHAYIIQMISGFLFVFLRQNPFGFALVEARYRLPSGQEKDLIPDLSFVSKARATLVRSGPAPYMPDLAVEAQSEGQSDKFMLDKAQAYLAHGSRMVWVIYCDRQLVEVLTPTARRILTINDTLDGGDVLPGFTVPVREIFPGIIPMLENLDKIDWKSYRAEYMPALIRDLASTDQKTSGQAYGQLEWIFAPWEQGADENYDDLEIQKRLEGGIPQLVTPFLIELIQVDGVIYKNWILVLLCDLSFYPQLKLQTEYSQKQARRVFELVKQGMTAYQSLLDDPDFRIKRGAEEVIERLQNE